MVVLALVACFALVRASEDEGEIEAAANTIAGQRVAMVIMAQGRSGSTLLGQTFRQNKVSTAAVNIITH